MTHHHLTPNDLFAERLIDLFDAAAIPGRIDEENDLYFTGEGLDFPVWLSVAPDHNRIRIFTFLQMGAGIEELQAHAFANHANNNWNWGCFSIQFKDGMLVFSADHSLLTTFGIDGRTLIATVRAFSSAFRKAIDRDRVERFFDRSNDETIELAPGDVVIRH